MCLYLYQIGDSYPSRTVSLYSAASPLDTDSQPHDPTRPNFVCRGAVHAPGLRPCPPTANLPPLEYHQFATLTWEVSESERVPPYSPRCQQKRTPYIPYNAMPTWFQSQSNLASSLLLLLNPRVHPAHDGVYYPEDEVKVEAA
jgi:hypothetical protein